MTSQFTVYGAKGSGSVAVEAALTLLGEPYELVEVPMTSFKALAGAVGPVNPMKQIPALKLASGELMTESAAILIWLVDTHGRLGPAAGDPARARFLRWMVYLPAAIYAMYWVRDVPSRLAADPAHEETIKQRTAERIADCWRMMDEQIEPGRYILGEELTVLDLYVAVLSRWTPGRRRFYEAAPKMAEVVRRVDAEPALAGFWAERFPFTGRWEG